MKSDRHWNMSHTESLFKGLCCGSRIWSDWKTALNSAKSLELCGDLSQKRSKSLRSGPAEAKEAYADSQL